MTTSGTSIFNLDIAEIIEEAYEQAGAEVRTGYDFRTARRSLNLLALDWANRGYNLWTVEESAIPLITDISTYALPSDTIDVVEMVVRTTSGTTNTDITIQRIGMPVYAAIPNKGASGRPIQAWVNRQIAPEITFWPVPNNDNYTLVYWYMRRIQDTGNSGEYTFDVPERFLPCLVSGLAYRIAMKRPDLAPRVPMLQQEYEAQWLLASTEDREKVPTRLVPRRIMI